MDWRLGISLIRILGDGNENLLADAQPGQLQDRIAELPDHHEMKGWWDEVSLVQQTLINTLPDRYEGKEYGDLLGIFDEANEKAFIIVHPLWRTLSDEGAKPPLITAALRSARRDTTNVSVIDTFNGIRRPSWSLANL